MVRGIIWLRKVFHLINTSLDQSYCRPPTVFIWKNYHIMNLSLPEDLLNYRHVRDNFPVHHLNYAVISTYISIATLRRIHLLNDFHSIFITIIWIYLIKLRTNCDISISFSYYEKNISFVPFKYNKHALCVYICFFHRVYIHRITV